MRLLRSLFFVATLAFAASASAQTSPAEIARRELLDQAEAARATGDHARALDLATRAAQLRVTPSLRLLLAQEHSALGHVLDALDQSSTCAREAAADTAMNNRERILDACRALSASLAPQVGHVVVRVSNAPDGSVVRVAGAELNAALWGVGYPVVPGEVDIDAQAPGGAPAHRTVTVAAGATVEVEMVVPAPPVVRPIETPPITQRVTRGPGAGPWVVLGLGAATLGASLAFFLLREDALATRDAECGPRGSGPGRCADRALAEGANSDYRTFTTITNVTLGVGAAGVAAGALWLLLGRGESAPARPRSAMNLRPFGDGAMLELSGAL
jgi:hypothetical protein